MSVFSILEAVADKLVTFLIFSASVLPAGSCASEISELNLAPNLSHRSEYDPQCMKVR